MNKKKSSLKFDKQKPKKKQEQTKTGHSTFFFAFIGEYVQLIGEFSTPDMRAVSNIEGYLLDEDEDFYYLGLSANEITTAIRKTAVYSIQVVQMKDAMTELLESLSLPTKQEEVN